MNKIQVTCEIEVTLKMIGGKAKPLILYHLIVNGPKRFNELLKFIVNMSPKTLTNQLRELEEDTLVKRQVFAEVPPRVEYSVTEKGASLYPILELMCEWGQNNMDSRFEIMNPQCTEE